MSSVLWLVLLNFNLAWATTGFPKGPDAKVTPGSVCQRPTEYRYPEKIRYCERNVDRETKNQVIRRYDRELGYHVQSMPRHDFKIDHLIPLCMGGSNEADNLWPQHKSVYILTDQLEQLSCEKMQLGVLSQARAMELIRIAKNDLSRVGEILREIESLR